MNYYILPKIKINKIPFMIHLSLSDIKNNVMISSSFDYFFSLILKQTEDDIEILKTIKYINPYTCSCFEDAELSIEVLKNNYTCYTDTDIITDNNNVNTITDGGEFQKKEKIILYNELIINDSLTLNFTQSMLCCLFNLVELYDTFSLFSLYNNNKNYYNDYYINIAFYGFDYDVVNTSVLINKNIVFNLNKIGFLKENKTKTHIQLQQREYHYLKKDKEEENTNQKYNVLLFNICSKKYQNNQYILLILEILQFILFNQEDNGNLILKVSDTLTNPIIELLYILNIFYEEKIVICKPISSNITNEERFIICKGFINLNTSDMIKLNTNLNETINYIKENNFLYEMYQNDNAFCCYLKKYDLKNPTFINSFININVPIYFINKIEESNVIIGHYQLDCIYNFINYIKNNHSNKSLDDKIISTIKNNTKKCIHFCEKYKIGYKKITYNNNKQNILEPSLMLFSTKEEILSTKSEQKQQCF